jgi:hypothetical protein
MGFSINNPTLKRMYGDDWFNLFMIILKGVMLCSLVYCLLQIKDVYAMLAIVIVFQLTKKV